MGPSLGSINRAILLACDYFISPMSTDIFSLLAIENMGKLISEWRRKFKIAIEQHAELYDIPYVNECWRLKYAGYVAQQYTTKSKNGKRRPVNAYENIIKRIPNIVDKKLVDVINDDVTNYIIKYDIGTIPNLNSIIPLSQTAHKPIINLEYGDGIIGSHFSKVKDFEVIIASIAQNLIRNMEELV